MAPFDKSTIIGFTVSIAVSTICAFTVTIDLSTKAFFSFDSTLLLVCNSMEAVSTTSVCTSIEWNFFTSVVVPTLPVVTVLMIVWVAIALLGCKIGTLFVACIDASSNFAFKVSVSESTISTFFAESVLEATSATVLLVV